MLGTNVRDLLILFLSSHGRRNAKKTVTAISIKMFHTIGKIAIFVVDKYHFL